MIQLGNTTVQRMAVAALSAIFITGFAFTQEATRISNSRGVEPPPRELLPNGEDIRIDQSDAVANNTLALAINPVNKRKVLAVSRIKAPDGHRGLGVYVSNDAGSSWTQQHFWDIADFVTLPAPAIVVTSSGATKYYVGHLSPVNELTEPRLLESSDEGVSWTEVSAPPGYQFSSQNTLIASPYFRDRLYYGFVWGNPLGSWDIVVAVSTNGGQTWPYANTISSGLSELNGGLSLAFGEGGILHAVWSTYDRGPDATPAPGLPETGMGFSRSTDGGESWSPPVAIITGISGVSAYDYPGPPEPKYFYGPINGSPSLAASNSSPTLLVAWANFGIPPDNVGDPDILLIRSTDGGMTWSNPYRVLPELESDVQVYPRLAMDRATREITLGFVNATAHSNFETASIWQAWSADDGVTWESAELSDSPFYFVPPGGDPYCEHIDVKSQDGYLYTAWNQPQSAWLELQRFVKSVTLDQYFLGGGRTPDPLAVWDMGLLEWVNHFPGTVEEFPLSARVYFRAHPGISNGHKFAGWNNSQSPWARKNYTQLQITEGSPDMTAWLHERITDVVISNECVDGAVAGGNIEFRDPWYRDLPDEYLADGNQGVRNRGPNDALWYPRPSPFSLSAPEYLEYQGALLNQAPPQGAEYSLRANPHPRPAEGWRFLGWTATGAELLTPQLPETYVMFTEAPARVSALYKAPLLSSTSSATGSNSQRKTVSHFGIAHVVYESAGRVWYTRVAPGSTPSVRELSHETGGTNPHIAVDEGSGSLFAVWESLEGDDMYAVYFTKSTDAGESWLAQPVRLVGQPGDPHRSLNPTHPIAVAKDGWPVLVYWKVSGGIAWAIGSEGQDPAPQPQCVAGSDATWREYSVVASHHEDLTGYVCKLSAIGGSPSASQVVTADITHQFVSGFGWNAIVQPNVVVLSNYSWMWDCRHTSIVAYGGKTYVVWDAMSSLDRIENRVPLESGGCGNPGTINRHAFVREFNGAWLPATEFEHCDHQAAAPVVGVDARPGVDRLNVVWNCGTHIARSSLPLVGGYWTSVEDLGTGFGVNVTPLEGGNGPPYKVWTSGSAAPFGIQLQPFEEVGIIFEELVEGQGELDLEGPELEGESTEAGIRGRMILRTPQFTLVTARGDTRLRFDRDDSTRANWLGTSAFAVPQDADSLRGEPTIALRGFHVDDPKLYPMSAIAIQAKVGPNTRELRRITVGQLAALGVADTILRLRHSASLRNLRGQNVEILQQLIGQSWGRNPAWSQIIRTVDVRGSEGNASVPAQVRSGEGTELRSIGLHVAYPNPFNPSTEIRFELPEASTVSLAVFDLLGRKVADLATGEYEAGYHSATWNATGIASGVYLARFTAVTARAGAAYTSTHKLVLMK